MIDGILKRLLFGIELLIWTYQKTSYETESMFILRG